MRMSGVLLGCSEAKTTRRFVLSNGLSTEGMAPVQGFPHIYVEAHQFRCH